MTDTTFDSDVEFREAVSDAIGEDIFRQHESELVSAAISMNPTLILFGILGFVASFAVSLGPVMWVLFSELFPNALRGIAISFVGLINSAVSFGVQLVFPWELAEPWQCRYVPDLRHFRSDRSRLRHAAIARDQGPLARRT